MIINYLALLFRIPNETSLLAAPGFIDLRRFRSSSVSAYKVLANRTMLVEGSKASSAFGQSSLAGI